MNEPLPTLAELKAELVPAMGAALIKLQFFELYVSGCLLALSNDGNHTINALLSGDATHRAPTLGILVRALHKTMPLDPQFEDRLGAFIENRNFFIHRLFVPDISLSAPTGETNIYEKLSFILSLMREIDALQPVFRGLYSLLHKAQLSTNEITADDELTQYARGLEVYEQQFLSILKPPNL